MWRGASGCAGVKPLLRGLGPLYAGKYRCQKLLARVDFFERLLRLPLAALSAAGLPESGERTGSGRVCIRLHYLRIVLVLREDLISDRISSFIMRCVDLDQV